MAESKSLTTHDASGLRFAVVWARYNDRITTGLLSGAEEYLRSTGAYYDVYEAPGAFELPLLAAELAASTYDGVIALGAVVNGETDHYEHVAGRASEGLMRVALDSRKPVAFGILTVQEEKHAVARSAPGPGNKGAEAAAAAVETVLTMRRIVAR